MRPVSINGARWNKIKQSLAAIGVHADSVSLTSRYSAQHPAKPMRPLRQALQDTVDHFGLGKPPTVSDRAGLLKSAQTTARRLRTQLQRLSAAGRNYPDYYLAHFYREKDRELCDRLREVENRRGMLEAAESDYRRALAEMWLNITGLALERPDVSTYRRKHLIQFLLACGAGSQQQIKNFVHNFFAKRQTG